MYKTKLLIVIISSVILCVAGCQPSQSEVPEQTVEPSVESSPAQEAKPVQASKDVEEQAQTDSQKKPKIVLIKASHDFGPVGPGTSHKADYEFGNEGDGILTVKGVQSTCGCSKPTLIKDGKRYRVPLKEPVVFEAGQKGGVEVTFKAGATKGNVNKHLYILSDDPKTPRAQLDVKAQVQVKVSVEPESVKLRFDEENAGMPDIIVKSKDGQAFSIKSVRVANKVVEVPFDAAEEAAEFTLKPQVDLQKLSKFNTGIIQISTTHPQAGTLMVRYNAKPMFEVSNPRFILQNVEPEKPIIRDNLIRSNYDKKAEIVSVESRNGYMEVESQEQDGNHIKLKIKITPPAQDAKTRRYITDELTITLKDGHILKVRCSGWFRLT